MVRERLPKRRRFAVRNESNNIVEEVVSPTPQKSLWGFRVGDPVRIKDWARPQLIEKVRYATGFIKGITDSGEASIHFMSWSNDEILVDGNYVVIVEKISKMIYEQTYNEMYKIGRESCRERE